MSDSATRTRKQNKRIPRPLRFELQRTYLLERLEQARDVKSIALMAPSGYGKTTLLAQFAHRTELAVVWVTLREDDADAFKLSSSIAQAIIHALPALPLNTWQEAAIIGATIERLAQVLAATYRN